MADEHTQGPWRASLTIPENDQPYWVILGTPNDKEDHLPHKGAFIGKITGVKDRQESNARLISAAPDLLAACEMSLSWFLKHSKYAETIIDGKWVDHPMVTMLEKAIDKARGES